MLIDANHNYTYTRGIKVEIREATLTQSDWLSMKEMIDKRATLTKPNGVLV